MALTEREFTCVECGLTFTSTAYKAKRCPNCRQEHLKQLSREHYLKNRCGKRKKACKETIGEIIRKLNEYNRIHNTHLTYGEYVSKVRSDTK